MRTIWVFTFMSALVLCGCQSTVRESTAVEDNLGKAVAQMRREQTSNPATLTGSQDQPVDGVDPEVAATAIESMRKDTPERAAVKRDILINVGTQQSSGGNQ
jgi:hypothetical protein